jgi:hypothetical protein
MSTFIIEEIIAPNGYFKFYTTANGLETSGTESEAFSWEDADERDGYLKDLDTAYPAQFGPGGSSNPPSGGGRPDRP